MILLFNARIKEIINNEVYKKINEIKDQNL